MELEPLRPYCLAIQKLILYETRSRLYIVGSNQSETKFRVLKIDRLEHRELVIVEDPAQYNVREIKELLSTLAAGSTTSKTGPGNLAKTVSAFGILGFVQFLEGYYVILITRRRKIASIGHHAIYKIEDTASIYIPCTGLSRNPDELRYLKLFQSIDLSSNFYFTYSYDLTNSLQYNVAQPQSFIDGTGSKTQNPHFNVQGFRNLANRKFVWNNKLLEPVENVLHPDWILHVIHGFIGQSNVSVYGKPVYMCLIARRSAQYAGTRFLKRGTDFEGNVANEVETEQIVFDSSVSSFERGRFTSFSQMRGSIPAHWSQDISKMVPKPPIGLDLPDPYAETAGRHFSYLLHRFGSPVVVLNLVKKKERRKHESILTTEYLSSITTLNQFLPPNHRIHYIGFDMAKTNKTKEKDVMAKLARISEDVIRKTGFFQTHVQLGINADNNTSKKTPHNFGRIQTGLVRVNCVDCLDRTNTAQFAIGKCALAHQFRALGLLGDDVDLHFESDVIRMLEELYEDHGDTLALQYGGSQLVHRINTYRKTAPWTSQGNDIMQTLSRYFSNTFSDAEKQNAINLFLGKYNPSVESIPLWIQENDIPLHLKFAFRFLTKDKKELQPLTNWLPDEVINALPLSAHERRKTAERIKCEIDDIDTYEDYYRPHELISLSEVFAFKISHSVRDFMPNSTVDFSPFTVRIRPGRRQEETISKKSKSLTLKNPTIMSLSSSTITNTSSESDEYSSSDDMNSSMASFSMKTDGGLGTWRTQDVSFSKFFPTMKESYGVELKIPRKSDISLYKKFVNLQQSQCIQAMPVTDLRSHHQLSIIPLSGFSKDSSYSVTPPTVSKVSRDIYKNFVQRGVKGASLPNSRDLKLYASYVAKSGNPSCLSSRNSKPSIFKNGNFT